MIVVLALVGAGALLVVLLSTGGGSAARPVRTASIGALFSLTGGGDVYGPQQERGARLAIDQINAQGGAGGVRLRLVLRDDGSDPVRGRSLMRTLIVRDRVLGVLGPSLSLVAVSTDPVASALHTPVVAVSNTANGIVGRCAYDCSWVWRDSLGEATAVPANIQSYARNRHVPSAAIAFVEADVLGVDEAQIAAAAFAREGIRVTEIAHVPKTGSLTQAMRTALLGNPQVLFVGATFGQRAADIIATARRLGFTGDFLGGNTFNSASTAGLVGAAGAGTQSGAAWYEGNDFPANRSFIAAYRQRYGSEPDQFAAQAYTGVQVIADAMRRGSIGATSRPLAAQRAVLQHSLGDVALTTPLGPLRFSRTHDVAQTVWILRATAKGEHELAGFCAPDC